MNSLSNSQTGGKCMCVIEHILKVFYKIEKFTKKKNKTKIQILNYTYQCQNKKDFCTFINPNNKRMVIISCSNHIRLM